MTYFNIDLFDPRRKNTGVKFYESFSSMQMMHSLECTGNGIWRNTLKRSCIALIFLAGKFRFSTTSERRPHQYPSTFPIKRVSLVPVRKAPACIRSTRIYQSSIFGQPPRFLHFHEEMILQLLVWK